MVPHGALAAAAFCLSAFVALMASPSAAVADLRVVVTSKPIHALVAGVMHGVAAADLLVDGAASPHTYAMRPSDAQKVSRADVFFRVSEALEPFTARVVKSLPRKVAVVTLAEAPGVKLLQRRQGGAFESQAHGHAHRAHKHGPSESYDAHVWLDPDNAKAMVRVIAATLTGKLPEAKAQLDANAAALERRLDALAASLGADLAVAAGRPFVVLHDAYQYFERRFGLTALGSITVSPDEQPSARRLTDLRRKVASLSAVCIFSEPGHHAGVVASVSERTSARTAVLDPEGTGFEPGPELYFDLMRKLAATMRTCLGPSA